MEFLTLAKNRYSCRKWKDTPVEKEKLDQIIQAAVLAPTGCNYQPWKIWIVRDEHREEFRETAKIRFEAPVYMLVGAKKDEAWTREYDDWNIADIDAAIVATHMILEIEELGLGTVWTGHFDAPALKEKYEVLKDYRLIGIFPIGYPDKWPSHLHDKTKEVADLVSDL